MRPDPAAVARLLLTTLLASATAMAEGSAFAVGTAYDRSSGQLLYREHHYCEPSRSQCVVRYKDTGGELIAQKDLDYRNSTVSPALVMVDFRRDSEVRIPFIANDELVVDAGFDNFVREQWDTLSAGQTVSFQFQGVGFDSPLDMKIGAATDADCADSQLCLAVNIDSWLLSAFVDPIQLYYSRDGRELQRYSGISNLKGDRGESMDVDIFYEYQDAGPTATPVYTFQPAPST
jgi:hypothetical protein